MMKKMIPLIVIAAGTVYLPAPAAAQSGTMLAPGIYTTADISRRCQAYTRRRVTQSGAGDNMRQSVFLACVQKLYNAQYGGGPAPVAAPVAAATAVVTAPLAGLAYATDGLASPWDASGDYEDYSISRCLTDEGFGRIGQCNGVVQ
jgi:hypothetical protein